ncbi:MAG TPA: glycosyltransferase family 39 protein [Pyrinomonadaceae bacterium]|nr:glycosyltransferase family 39 protein [Pyrinomonadaceae bacterium]
MGITIFMFAFGVRVLAWQDNYREVSKVETSVTSEYTDSTRQLLRGDLRAFASDLNHMEHPPGYSTLLAGIFKIFGESESAIQLTQMIADSAAAVFVFLIAGEVFSLGIAAIAGFLAALSPQFAYYSVLLLPDSLAVLPILIAVYFLIRAIKHPRLLSFVIAGAFVGLSCWLRANALLLAPILACLVPLLLPRGRRLRNSLALIFGAAILITPITIKNAVVFHRFIPLSLGAGQKLLEGIAEYDQGRFDIPRTDLGIMRQEAAMYSRPDYAFFLFGPDGIERDRMRIRRGMAIIRAHPVWYSGVMFRRGVSFFKLARVPITATEAPVSHALEVTDTAPAWTNSPSELLANAGFVSAAAKAALSGDAQKLRIESDETKYGVQLVSTPIALEKHHDYLLRLPLKLEDGRVMVRVTDAKLDAVLASTDVDLNEGLTSLDQPVNNLGLPFVSGNESQVCVSLANNAPVSAHSVAEIGRLELFDRGPSSQAWMRYPRFPIRNLQKFFVTAAVLPCVILGIGALLWTRNFRTLILLLVVPAYYVIFQSALHTERRYVIAIHYFTLIFAAVFLSAAFGLVKQAVLSLRLRAAA